MSPKSYEQSDLLEAVQRARIFPDGKTFVDCRPRIPLPRILQVYTSEKENSGFSLTDFVHAYFEIPAPIGPGFEANQTESIQSHIQKLWPVLTRKPAAVDGGSLIPLPYPYVVPGGRFREIYYWDSYFTMLGLAASGQMGLVENMVMNFAHLIDTVGYVPNGNRTYYIGRSQPPFFSLMVRLLANHSKPGQLVRFLPQLKKEYEFWMRGQDELSNLNEARFQVVQTVSGETLNRYWDEEERPRPESFLEDQELAQKTSDCQIYRHLRAGAASGWDFSSRWFRQANDFSTIHTTDIIPVDLNCLLYDLEKTIAEAAKDAAQPDIEAMFTNRALRRKMAILKYCWSPKHGFFMDYDWKEKTRTESRHLGACFPLFVNIATPDQADRVADILEKEFLKPGGLLTTLQNTGQQWDAPNGWAPLQWVAIKGLRNYGKHDLANEIRLRWMTLNEQVFRRTGKLMEKYNVVDTHLEAGGGEYPGQDGFGWTNGVFAALNKES